MYMKDMDLHLELGVTDTDRVTHHFLNRFSGDPVTLDRNYSVEMSFFDVIGIVTEIAKTVATKVKVLMLRGQACSVIAHDGGEPSLLVNVTRSRHCQPDEVKRSHFDVVIVGGKKDTIACRDQLNEALGIEISKGYHPLYEKVYLTLTRLTAANLGALGLAAGRGQRRLGGLHGRARCGRGLPGSLRPH